VEDFKQIRENLLEMLEGLDDRLSSITDSDTSQAKVFEKNNDVFSNSKEENIDDVEVSNLKAMEKIKQAISNIDQATYGICLICGQAIKTERLSSDPFSKNCKQCMDIKNDD
jgi:RNA polymerase-binding transcription factor DksA